MEKVKKKLNNAKCWKECKATKPLICHPCKCKLTQPLWKIVENFYIFCNLLLDSLSRKIKPTNGHTNLKVNFYGGFTHNYQKLAIKSLSNGEWINKLLYMHTAKYY